MYNLPVFHNERDIEIPLLFEFVRKMDGQYLSVLDVGCSFAAYTKELKGMVGELHGVDLLRQENIVQDLDFFYQEDFLTADLPMCDLVVSVSTIEHVGVEYLPSPLYKELQITTFAKMLSLAKVGLFLTFPYGEDILMSGFYYNGHRSLLEIYEDLARGLKIKKSFYSTLDPKDPAGWREIPQDLADKSTGCLAKGVDTICVLEVYK